MSNGSYAHVGCATVMFGGFGLLLFGVGLDELSGSRLAPAGGYMLGAVAAWGFLAFLWAVNIRANGRRAWVARQPYPHLAEKGLKRGGFLKGAAVTWVLVAAAHVAAYIAVFQPSLPDNLRTPVMSLAYGILPLCHLVVPVLGGFLWSAWVGSSTPRSR